MRLQELLECSGYVPQTAEEARDPRWSRALSVDVGINTMREEIKRIYPTEPVGSRHLQVVKEAVNPKIFNDIENSLPMFGTKPVRIGDYMFDVRTFIGGLGHADAKGLQIRAYDPKRPKGEQRIGSVDFIVKTDKKGNSWLESDDTEVDEEYRGKGVANLMYAYAKSLGNDIKPSPYQSTAGSNMWRKWGKDAEHLVGESVNNYLWHGSRTKHSVLTPQQATDTGGAEGSNKNAIYATPSAKVAIAMGLTTPGSDTGMFPNDPQMVLFKGDIRKGQMVYLHKVPKDLFIKHNGREWYSKPDVKEIKIPNENIVEVPVDKHLDLIRTATAKDLELQKKYASK